jgi:FixJ family two-component response regulator
MELMHSHSTGARSGLRSLETSDVFIVDQDSESRDSTETLIRSAGWHPRTADSAEEFLALPRCTSAACLLVELDLPGMGGLDLQRRILDRTELPVIFMSSHAGVSSIVQAMKAGAIEFLSKPCTDDEILRAIQSAVEHSHAALLQLTHLKIHAARYESLSRRERQVMGLVVAGRLNKQIGGDLGISEITVKAHRGSMMRKMQASGLADLVRMSSDWPETSAGRTRTFEEPQLLALEA